MHYLARTMIMLMMMLSATSTAFSRDRQTGDSVDGPRQTLKGTASWYGKQFSGRPTSSGEIFDPQKLTAAHKTLPIGTIVKVRNQRTQRAVIVRINDRGPFIKNRIIDISQYAATVLDMHDNGTDEVVITVMYKPSRIIPYQRHKA